MPLYTFSLSELVHVGILSYMSSYGIIRSQLPMAVRTVEGISTGGQRIIGKEWLLTEPEKITKFYQDRHFDLCYVLESTQFLIQGSKFPSGARNKQALLEHQALIVSPLMVQSLLAEFMSDTALFYGTVIPGQLILHVGMVARDAGMFLGLERTWEPFRG